MSQYAANLTDDQMIDMQSGKRVEILRDQKGKLWINVDGVCRLRIGEIDELLVQDDLESDGSENDAVENVESADPAFGIQFPLT